MSRISRQTMFMEMARTASRRATCFRLNVGAIITKDNNPISIGWNGQPPGEPHCPGNDCPGVIPGHCNTDHAEVNALKKAEEVAISGDRSVFREWGKVDMYLTHSPCEACTNRIRESAFHVERLFFEVPYRNTEHLHMLRGLVGPVSRTRKTEVYEVTPAGYVIDYFSRQVVELP